MLVTGGVHEERKDMVVVDPRDCDPEGAKEESTSDLKKSV
jgi:endo-alpha-1,4-polygalactosaminidase (GH114 family)